ncbi:hypothetical protein BC629DRAFT_42535 [Irpex lacteus]|nr:hypothetical protein BC629DRAFT_42535 [Irpex lacteus]
MRASLSVRWLRIEYWLSDGATGDASGSCADTTTLTKATPRRIANCQRCGRPISAQWINVKLARSHSRRDILRGAAHGGIGDHTISGVYTRFIAEPTATSRHERLFGSIYKGGRPFDVVRT